MAFSYSFEIEKKKFDKRLLTELQHKIRVPLKCYTIINFILKEDNTFEFNKTWRKMRSGVQHVIPDSKLHHGKYLKEESSEQTYKVTITFYD